jgi:hypothetical protein
MAGHAVHGRGGSSRSSGPPGEPRGTVVVVPTSIGGPPGALGLVTSGCGGSLFGGSIGDPVVGPVVGPVEGDVGVDVVGSLVDRESAPVVVGAVPCCSRSCSSTSLGVIGVGRAMLTSRATRSTAALTPSTIRAVVTTQVPAILRTGPMTRVCDRLIGPRVKPW